MRTDCEKKRALRKEMLALRRAQPAEQAAFASEQAQRQLLASPVWQGAATLAAYVGVNGEMGTDMLLHAAWAQGKTVLLPRCRTADKAAAEGEQAAAQTGLMDFVACAGREYLRPARFGLLEPAPELPAEETLPDLFIVPAVAYDKTGSRLGYGGGYYDRFLARAAAGHAAIIGLAFQFQIVEHLPAEPWDQPVQALCTERGLVWL